MKGLNNKKILLGISGGIAAYKSAELCRLLIKQGADVRVVMTDAAQQFIQPLTFQALTGNAVYTQLFEADASHAMDHIELARWCDLLLIAPATADILAKLAHGYADNLLLTIALASEKPIAVAPAMNQQMFHSDANQQNLKTLQARNVKQWGPAAGVQACGEVGPGRMLEPAQLLELTQRFFAPGKLDGVQVLITAGPTREAIDPVRYISNRSSGKMGYAMAAAAQAAGAVVTLVSGPVCLSSPLGVQLRSAESAQEMQQQVLSAIDGQHIFIATAAVADYRPAQAAGQKIKKSAATLSLELVRNPDILATVAARDNKPFCVGFAAETQDLEDYARQKLADKNLDMIAANRVDSRDRGFDVDDNALTLFWPGGSTILPLQTKTAIAHALIDIIADRYQLLQSKSV